MNNIMSPRHTRTHPTFTGKKNVYIKDTSIDIITWSFQAS